METNVSHLTMPEELSTINNNYLINVSRTVVGGKTIGMRVAVADEDGEIVDAREFGAMNNELRTMRPSLEFKGMSFAMGVLVRLMICPRSRYSRR